MKKTQIYYFILLSLLFNSAFSVEVLPSQNQPHVIPANNQIESIASQPSNQDPSNSGQYLHEGRGYAYFNFGKANSPYEDFKAPNIALIGIGKEFGVVGIQVDYFLFDHINLADDSNTYIKLHGGRVFLYGYLDLGWPELNIGISRVYYDAKSYINSRKYSQASHTTYGVNAGLTLPITTDFDLSLNAQVISNILKQDFEFYTLGFNFYL